MSTQHIYLYKDSKLIKIGHLSQEDADLHHILVFLCQTAIMDIITWLISLLLLYIPGKT